MDYRSGRDQVAKEVRQVKLVQRLIPLPKNHLFNDSATYQVRFFLEPNRLSCIAVLIVSIRSKLVKISGMTMFNVPLIRLDNLAFLDSSTPRACCAAEMDQ